MAHWTSAREYLPERLPRWKSAARSAGPGPRKTSLRRRVAARAPQCGETWLAGGKLTVVASPYRAPRKRAFRAGGHPRGAFFVFMVDSPTLHPHTND
jgi:hypothetical protein